MEVFNLRESVETAINDDFDDRSSLHFMKILDRLWVYLTNKKWERVVDNLA